MPWVGQVTTFDVWSSADPLRTRAPRSTMRVARAGRSEEQIRGANGTIDPRDEDPYPRKAGPLRPRSYSLLREQAGPQTQPTVRRLLVRDPARNPANDADSLVK